MKEYFYDKIYMNKPKSREQTYLYLTIMNHVFFVPWFRWESFGRVNLQGRKITTLRSTLPAAQETRWNDLTSCPLHVASRLKKQGGITSFPVPSTWLAGKKHGGVIISYPIHVASRQETWWNDLISYPIHVASRQETWWNDLFPILSTWLAGKKHGGITSFPVHST
jgi:hypothetical protein